MEYPGFWERMDDLFKFMKNTNKVRRKDPKEMMVTQKDARVCR